MQEMDTIARKALQIGRQQADEVLKLRTKALQQRMRAVRRARTSTRAAGGPPIAPQLMRAVGGSATAGVLVAEGDSWFDYPLHDVLQLLEDHHGYEVESVAHRGDRVEDMAYALGQLEEFTRRIEKLLRRNVIPKAILLSGGGNDVAGTEFGMLLNHARSPLAGLNQQILNGVINERLRVAYLTILSAITRICKQRLDRHIPILIHGYDYPVPDGRGFLGGWGPLPGPWLEPGFRAKGYDELKVRIALAKQLIDHFNAMLQGIVSVPALAHVKYVDLRNSLSVGKDYKRDWANELHPTAAGFRRITDRFAAKLAALP
jgi:lysophospholipase L1-like esterase